MRSSRLVPTTLIALLAGLTVGWLDLSATDVQGPALLFMVSAFVVAMASRAPEWVIALAVAAGLPLAHIVSGHGDLSWGMLLVVAPASLAAYGGRRIATLIGRTQSSLMAGDENVVAGSTAAWYARAASPPLLLGVALLGCALAGAGPVYASLVARGQPFAWWVTTIWQIISFVAWAIAAPGILRFWHTMRRDDGHGIAVMDLAANAAVAAAVTVQHAVALPVLTRVLFIPLGPAGIGTAFMYAIAVYLPLDALTYCLIVGLGHASNLDRRARAAAAREAAIRGELATARLASLRSQLQPHFLFNALNAATVLARRGDRESSTRVLTQLGELLRYVLRGAESTGHADSASRGGETDFATLGDEVAFAESYLAIERERFPDRLTTSVDIAPEVRNAIVPHLLLQPLVENAVQHGVGTRLAASTVSIRARRADGALQVVVENTGTGAAPPDARSPTSRGIGLSNTRARLATIYGASAELTLTEGPDGGATVRVAFPFRQ